MNTDTPLSTKCRVNSFLTCDAVHFDPATGKHTLLGIFSSLKGRNFPIVHPKMVWFLSLSELTQGKHNVKMSLADPTGELEPKPIINRDFESKGAHIRVNLVNELHRVKFIKAKNYSIVIEIDDEIIFVDTFPVKDEYSELSKKLEDILENSDNDYDDDNDDDFIDIDDDNVF